MTFSRVLGGCVLLTFVTACGVSAWRSARSADDAVPTQFDAAQVARGAQLAAIGNCSDCHTAPNGRPYAGGVAMPTQFGTLYSTNITPDAQTGLGRWTLEDFKRAMREGVDKAGRHLYPAFPYDHFSLVSDEDLAALYAYTMTREPVRATAPKNELMFPMNFRPAIGLWKALYFKPEPFRPDAAKSAEWNRGAYLVEGLAHCGACHTPRNFLGAERRKDDFAGGTIEGWHAPALNSASPAPLPWTVDRLVSYLRTGIDDVHGAAAGPMKSVVHNLSGVSDQDVRAIAVYVASLDERPAAQRDKPLDATATTGASSPQDEAGQGLYATACASCHGAASRGQAGTQAALQLAQSSAVHLPTPLNLIRIIRDGIVPREGEAGPWMPPFAGVLTDQQVTDLVTYLRARAGSEPWKDVAKEVKRTSHESRQVSAR